MLILFENPKSFPDVVSPLFKKVGFISFPISYFVSVPNKDSKSEFDSFPSIGFSFIFFAFVLTFF